MKKIIEILKTAWNWICSKVSKAVDWIMTRSQEKWLCLVLGLIVTAFSCITLHIEFPPVLVIAIAAIHAFIRNWNGKPFLWKDYVAALIGAVIIWLIALI